MEYAVAQVVGCGHQLSGQMVHEVYFGIVPDIPLRDGRVLIYNFRAMSLELRWVHCPECKREAKRDNDLEYNAPDCVKCNGLWLQSMLEEG
jgi:hypothetical protein